MKKIIFAVLLVLSIVALSIVGASGFYKKSNTKTVKKTSMEFFQYESIAQLGDSASDIIKGKVIQKETRMINTWIPNDSGDEKLNPRGEADTMGEIYTVYKLSIDKVYKGKYKSGDTIEIKQLGGETEKVIHRSDEQIDFNETDNYVFFIKSYDGVPGSLLNPTQSSYIYSNEIGKSTSRSLRSVNNENNLTVTYEELDGFLN